MLVEHAGIEAAEFAQEDFVFAFDVVGVAGHHEEQQRVALNVAQKTQTEATPLAGSLNDSGNIGHDEGFAITIGHNAEPGLKGGEWIVGYLGAGGREAGKQGGLAGIGKSHQTHVGQEFQFHNDHHLLHGFAGLSIARRLVGGGAELPVAQSATAALEEHHHLAVFRYIANVFAGFGVINHGAAGHIDVFVLAIGTMGAAFRTIASMSGKDVALVAQVQQRPVIVVAAQINVAAATSVASIGTAVGLVFGSVKVHGATAALA